MYRYNKVRVGNKTRDSHRLIMEKHLGRKLTFNEVVDHINGNQKDDRLENLRVMTRSEHSKMHMKEITNSNEWKDRQEKMKDGSKIRRLPHTKNKFTCCHCKKLKDKSKFWPLKSRWNGLRPLCIECETNLKGK